MTVRHRKGDDDDTLRGEPYREGVSGGPAAIGFRHSGGPSDTNVPTGGGCSGGSLSPSAPNGRHSEEGAP